MTGGARARKKNNNHAIRKHRIAARSTSMATNKRCTKRRIGDKERRQAAAPAQARPTHFLGNSNTLTGSPSDRSTWRMARGSAGCIHGSSAAWLGGGSRARTSGGATTGGSPPTAAMEGRGGPAETARLPPLAGRPADGRSGWHPREGGGEGRGTGGVEAKGRGRGGAADTSAKRKPSHTGRVRPTRGVRRRDQRMRRGRRRRRQHSAARALRGRAAGQVRQTSD